jgi:hypothetical protein
MKWNTSIALFSAAVLTTVGSALAQAQTVEAKVPFAFVVRNQVLPAGTYRIHSIGSDLLEIRTGDNTVISTRYVGNNRLGDGDKLLFAKYGNQYFLREIFCESANINSALPVSKQEKSAQISEARLRMAEQTVAAVR